jgi:hypothetical protein
MAKTTRMKSPRGGHHGQSRTRLHRPKMSVIGKTAYGGGAGAGPPMAFPAAPQGPGDGGGAPAFGPPDLGGGQPPSMGPGGGPPEI